MNTSTMSFSPTLSEQGVREFLTAALGPEADSWHISLREGAVILRGAVTCYSIKAQAEASLRTAGIQDVVNCLRVMPAATPID